MSDGPSEDHEPGAEAPRPLGASPVTRRVALRTVGLSMAGLHLGSLQGCADASGPDVGDGGGSLADGAVTDATGADGGDAQEDGSTDGQVGAPDWASGGTAAMDDPASYPDPFAASIPTSCSQTCTMTVGPCYDPAAPSREDISEGKAGLPVRLGVRVVDEDCNPLVGAQVDVWHCDAQGVYSSAAVASPSFCTGDDPVALAAQWFRGQRTSDASGVVWFSSCVPGWYPGRALHVHVTVRSETSSGQQEYLTTQLLFEDALAQRICGQHPDYAARGTPDRLNVSDTVLPAGDLSPFILATKWLPDGALLAHGTLFVRLTGATC